MVGRHVVPEYDATPFTCPWCETLAPQESGRAGTMRQGMNGWTGRHHDDSLYLTYCTSCERKAVWARLPDFKRKLAMVRSGAADNDEMPEIVTLVYPRISNAPAPNPDLPVEVAANYKEAASVLSLSPRSSAALLRLCLQKLCVELGQPGKDVNSDIGALVKAGTIRPLVQRAMDTIRISGNESVHPGELNVNDDKELALALFDFVNLIAEEAITQPSRVDAMFAKMPEAKRDVVAKRDGTPPFGRSTTVPSTVSGEAD